MAPKPRPVEDRFWIKVDIRGTDDCWEWRAYRARDGYGHFTRYHGCSPEPAHRVAYELFYENVVSKELQMDHLCRNRGCVNPHHLEAVCPRENNLRGFGPAAWNAYKTLCPRGHAYDKQNTAITAAGTRACRACRRQKERDRLAAEGRPVQIPRGPLRLDRTLCPAGHDPSYYKPGYDGRKRRCRACEADANRRYNEKRRETRRAKRRTAA